MVVEILTKAGLIKVNEGSLASYKSKGAVMPDGSEIKIGEEEKKEEKPKPKKKAEKKEEKTEKESPKE